LQANQILCSKDRIYVLQTQAGTAAAGIISTHISAQYPSCPDPDARQTFAAIIISSYKINPEQFKNVLETGKDLYVIVFTAHVVCITTRYQVPVQPHE
jgi:hypothetical protein